MALCWAVCWKNSAFQFCSLVQHGCALPEPSWGWSFLSSRQSVLSCGTILVQDTQAHSVQLAAPLAWHEIPTSAAHLLWSSSGISVTFIHNTISFIKCVCVLMPTHWTITCFGFHARWRDGVKCGLFSNRAPLGQTTLRVGWVSVKCKGGSWG